MTEVVVCECKFMPYISNKTFEVFWLAKQKLCLVVPGKNLN